MPQAVHRPLYDSDLCPVGFSCGMALPMAAVAFGRTKSDNYHQRHPDDLFVPAARRRGPAPACSDSSDREELATTGLIIERPPAERVGWGFTGGKGVQL